VNGTVVYSLVDGHGFFTLNSTTGSISLLQDLHQHPQASFQIAVDVHDLGTPRRVGARAVFTVVLQAMFVRFSVTLCDPSLVQQSAASVAQEWMAAAGVQIGASSSDLLLLSASVQTPRFFFTVQVFEYSGASAGLVAAQEPTLSARVDALALADASVYPALAAVLASCPGGSQIMASSLLDQYLLEPERIVTPVALQAHAFTTNYTAISASDLLRQYFVDVQGRALDLLVSNMSAGGQWVEAQGAGSLRALESAGEQRVGASSTLSFIPGPGFFGVITIGLRVVVTGQPVMPVWQPFGNVSSQQVVLVSVVQPPTNGRPFLTGEPVALPSIVEDTGVENSPTEVRNLGQLGVPQQDLLALGAAPSAAVLAVIPASVQAAFMEGMAIFNAIVSRRRALTAPGIGVVGAGNPNAGTWQYSLETDRPEWQAFPLELGSNKVLLLPGRALLRFIPAANFWGPASFLFVAWDGAQENPASIVTPAQIPTGLGLATQQVRSCRGKGRMPFMHDQTKQHLSSFTTSFFCCHVSNPLFFFSFFFLFSFARLACLWCRRMTGLRLIRWRWRFRRSHMPFSSRCPLPRRFMCT
jgi:hypothetical protein